jgi:hypothetical protein
MKHENGLWVAQIYKLFEEIMIFWLGERGNLMEKSDICWQMHELLAAYMGLVC